MEKRLGIVDQVLNHYDPELHLLQIKNLYRFCHEVVNKETPQTIKNLKPKQTANNWHQAVIYEAQTNDVLSTFDFDFSCLLRDLIFKTTDTNQWAKLVEFLLSLLREPLES